MNVFRLLSHSTITLFSVFAISSPNVRADGLGCATSSFYSPCVNPVPNSNVTGTWTRGSDIWTLAMSSPNAVTGLVKVKAPNSSCLDVTYQVSGTISPLFMLDYQQGMTNYNWTASNPSPNIACFGDFPAVSGTVTGNLRNNSNDGAEGSIVWTYQSAPNSSYSYFMLKTPSDHPISEFNEGVGFSSGLLSTVAQFRLRLNPAVPLSPNNIFRGRQVREYTSFQGPRYDSCYFPGSMVPIFDQVQGSIWNIGYFAGDLSNTLVDDYIGWNSAHVAYYRAHWPLTNLNPCSSRIQQEMHISFSGYYAINDLWTRIYPAYVTVQRGSVTQQVNQ